MNRQQVLVGLLALVAVTLLPLSYVERVMAGVDKEKKALDQQVALLREKATAVRDLQRQAEEATTAMAGVEQRLLGSNPFADMEREIRAAAARAGVRVSQLALGGATEVKGLPLRQYSATVEVAGTVAGFEEFLRLLEQHPLLIEIPDLKLQFTGGPLRTTLSLHFYGKGDAR